MSTVQFGGRVNWASFSPEGGLPDRDFTDGSASVGVLFRPAAANDKLTFAVSLARAARNPALEELYFFGVAPGQLRVRDRKPRSRFRDALGFDASVRWRHRRFSGEMSYFRNRIDDYIFRNPISDEEFEERFPDERCGGVPGPGVRGRRQPAPRGRGACRRRARDGPLAELGFDLVRGELRATSDPLPRIPPRGSAAACGTRPARFRPGASRLGRQAGPRLRRGDADRRLQPAEAVRRRIRSGTAAPSTPSPRGSTTRPTSSTGTTSR